MVDVGSWPVPAVFGVVQQWGTVPDQEMFRVFNMGIGYLAVVDPEGVDSISSAFRNHGHDVHTVGRIGRGTGGAVLRM